jgi:hypothetical protein
MRAAIPIIRVNRTAPGLGMCQCLGGLVLANPDPPSQRNAGISATASRRSMVSCPSVNHATTG